LTKKSPGRRRSSKNAKKSTANCRRCSAWPISRSAAAPERMAANQPRQNQQAGRSPMANRRPLRKAAAEATHHPNKEPRRRGTFVQYNMIMSSMLTTDAPRRRRFHRAEPGHPMWVTARDLALLDHVRRHRFLSSTHLTALDGGNASNVLARLRKLFDNAFLERPTAQLAVVPVIGPQPMVYGLATSGARLLREHERQINDGVGWTEKTRRAGAIYIEHTLAVADFMVRLELACRGTDDVEVIQEKEILATAPPHTRAAREPLRWVAEQTIRGKREISVIPDGMFGLRFADGTGTFVLLEIDRGTIPIVRRGNTHRSITRKLSTYIEGWRAGRHLRQFGIENLRVLMVTSSAARMDNMLAAVDDLTAGKGTGFLLFGHAGALAGQNPLDYGWTNGRREIVRLTD
jgi:Replication-relaxation